MKKLLFFTLIAVMISATLVISESQALNPFITSQYAADPSAHVFSSDPNTIYVYPSHDDDNAEWFEMWDYHVYSSTDLKKWTDHGVILHINDVPWKPVKWMWAPDCAYNGGKYYFYFCASTRTDSDGNNAKPNDFKIGVAVSDSPTGPFKPEPDGIKDPSDPKGYIWGNDPCVFVDDGGQAYLYWGGQGHGCMEKPKYVKLKSDMKTIDGKPEEISGLPEWYEGCYVHKRNSTYYLSYPTKGPNARILYATGPSPKGPWKYCGEVIGGNTCWTQHHSFEEFPKDSGNWYGFYQNMELSGHDKRRSICVDRVYYNADESMTVVSQTRTGTGTDAFQRIKAQLYHEQCGKTTPDPDPPKTFGTGLEDVKGDIGKCVNWINPGDWLLYNDLDFSANSGFEYQGGKIAVQVASPFGPDRNATLTVSATDGSFSKTIPIPKTGEGMDGWQSWKTVTAYLPFMPGGTGAVKHIKFTAGGKGSGNGDGSTLFNFNTFKFSKLSANEAPLGTTYIKAGETQGYWLVSGNDISASYTGNPKNNTACQFAIETDKTNSKYINIKYITKGVYVRAEGTNGELKITGGTSVDSNNERFLWENQIGGYITLKNVGAGNYVGFVSSGSSRLGAGPTIGKVAFNWTQP
jgi:hypothetical protein